MRYELGSRLMKLVGILSGLGLFLVLGQNFWVSPLGNVFGFILVRARS